MKSIITEIEKLKQPSEPLTFLSKEGAKTEEGQEIISDLLEIDMSGYRIAGVKDSAIAIHTD